MGNFSYFNYIYFQNSERKLSYSKEQNTITSIHHVEEAPGRAIEGDEE